MQPADDCVADFIAGISRLKVVKAHAVMQSLDMFEQQHGPLSAEHRSVSESEDLSDMRHMTIADDPPIVMTGDGKRLESSIDAIF